MKNVLFLITSVLMFNSALKAEDKPTTKSSVAKLPLTVFDATQDSTRASNWQEYNVDRIELHRKMNHDNARQTINVPDIDGLKTLKCDFHIHTVFSDGDVWPTVRVKEAWQEGLDVIALTDHTSDVPSKKNIIGGPNAPYEIAKPEAEELGIMLIHATEISRDKEKGGHLNAIFITDAVPLLNENTAQALKEATKQGAFIIWNHPGWDIDTCKMFKANEKFIADGNINAVEVFNEAEWYPRALRWTKQYNIAAVATSDIHGLVKNQYHTERGVNRPMTLVFAKDKTQESLKEALFAHQTLAYFDNSLAGDNTLLAKFMKASLKIEKISSNDKRTSYLISNISDIPYQLTLESGTDVLFPSNAGVVYQVQKGTSSIKANVRNLHTDEFKSLNIEIELK